MIKDKTIKLAKFYEESNEYIKILQSNKSIHFFIHNS